MSISFPSKYTAWNLSPLFSSDEDPHIQRQKKTTHREIRNFVNRWKNRDEYLENPVVLKLALDAYEKLVRDHGDGGAVGYYFWLRAMQDQTDTRVKAKLAQFDEFSTKMENKLQFFTLRLAKIPKHKQKEFLKSKSLAVYRHFLDRIFKRAAYVLSEKEEKILNLTRDPAYTKWTQMISTFLSKEQRPVQLERSKRELKNLEELATLVNNTDKNVRDEAGLAINDILEKNADAAEAELNAVLSHKKIDDELRGIKRPDFIRHINDDMESETVDILIDAVSKRFDISKRYYKLKAKLLGVHKLAYHERNVVYRKADKQFSFKEASNLVLDVFKRLDPEFGQIFSSYLKNGHIDVYPAKGKRGGAFCAHWLITQPTYIVLNYTDTLRDVTTLAHELGHGINNELIKQKQNALNFGTSMATAEVASTFMEDFIVQELLRKTDDETSFSLLLEKLNDDISTIFRQVACYMFEKELHALFRQNGYLSRHEIGAIFTKYMASYMGDVVEQSAGSENWWVHWMHIRNYFYVYSYASGLLISKSLQKSVKENPLFILQVKNFLSSGLSDSPKHLFKKMGVDITKNEFWNKGLDDIEKSLNEAELLAKSILKPS